MAEERIEFIEKFKSTLQAWQKSHDPKLREWLNQNVHRVRSEAIEADGGDVGEAITIRRLGRINAASHKAEQALAFAASGIGCPLTVLADCEEALLASEAIANDVMGIAQLLAHAKADKAAIPNQRSGRQSVNDGLGDLAEHRRLVSELASISKRTSDVPRQFLSASGGKEMPMAMG